MRRPKDSRHRPGGMPRAFLMAALVFAAGLAAAPARADFDPEAWGYYRDIRAAEGADGKNARVELDNPVWDRAAGPGLQDLRILKGETDDIGYVVYAPEKEPPRIAERPGRVINNAKRAEEATELTVDLGEDPPIANRVRLETTATDFRCAVAVEGSDDGKTWKTIRENGAIFAFKGDVERQFTTVAFPDTKMRYLRFVVSAPPGGKPIDLAGAVVLQETEPPPSGLPALKEHPVNRQTRSEQRGETWLLLDLGAKHLPVSKVLLEVAGQNFARAVRVDAGDNEKTLGEVGRGFIFRYSEPSYRKSHLEVEFGEAFGRLVRLRIANGDDPPLEVVRASVLGRPRYVFFAFERNQRYRLFYDNPQARPPDYEYARVFRHIDRQAAIEARLGTVVNNPRFIATRAAEPPSPWLVRNQWVLYAGLGVAVAALALVTLRSLRRPAGDDEAAED